MKLKKVLSGFLSAAILATTTAIVMPLNAVAADVTLGEMGNSDIDVSRLGSATQARITFNITTLDDTGYGTLTAYVNGDTWREKTYATSAQYASGAGQSWQADEEVTATGEQSVTLNFSPAEWGYQIGIKTSDASAISGKLTKVEFLNASDDVVAEHDATAASISKNNFTLSTISDEEMAIGDSFTVTYESDNTPPDATFSFKYKIPNKENASDDNTDFDYFAPIENGVATEQGKTETGLKVTSAVNGTKTIYTFTAVAASTAKYPFKLNVEVSRKGDWSDTDYSIWLGDTSFYVPKVPVESVAIGGTGVTNKKLLLEKGENATLTATVTPDEASAEDKAVTWAVSAADPAGCVTVDTTGKVTAVKAGTATVTATTAGKDADNKAVSDSVEVIVSVTATGVKIATPTKTNLVVNDELQLEAAPVPEDASDAATITWSSSDATIATVDATGKVTAKKAGSVEITATMGTFTDKVALTVTDEVIPATAITVTSENLINGDLKLCVDDVEIMTATLTPSDSTDTVTWEISDTTIATVVNGKVTALREGSTTLTVKANDNAVGNYRVEVSKKVVPITGVTLDKPTASVEVGKTVTLTATVAPADTTEDKTVTWSSSDEAVATVENGTVTALKAGETTITATAGGKSATCAVTVTAKASEIETKPYTLNVVDASGWGEAGVTKAAQVNVPVTTLNGFTVGTTTYKDVKSKTLKLENLGFGSCTAAGVNAENVDVCIYLQFGSGWTWCATGGNTLADASVEYDLSTLADNGVKDADVLQAIGFQFNIKGNAGGINDMALDAKVTLNAAEPKFTVVGEEPPAEDSDYDTGRVETVDDYVPANAGTELVVKSITAAEAARYASYTITVTDNNGKSYTTTTSDCYKAFKYNTASGEKTEEAAGFFIIVKVTNVPAGTTVSVTIEPTV